MADYRRHYDDGPRRNDRDWSERPADDVRSWFSDEDARYRRGNDDREDRMGTYRTDDRDLHERYRSEHRHRDEPQGYRERDAAHEYYRAARDQRDDLLRYSAQSGGATWGDEGRSHSAGNGTGVPWTPRERGGYWRHYDGPNFAGRGPKDYQRSDDRIREEICDCMTDDPLLDASEIAIDVKQGEVTLTGSVTSRDQKRRAEDVAERISGVKDVTNQLRVTREANGHGWASDSSRASGPATSSQPVTQASGKGTPSKSSGTSA